MPQTLEALEFVTGPEPTASIIVLHGLGADGNDFVPVAQMLDLGVPVRFIFPHAPQMPVTINNGHVMRAWYDILGTDLARREDEVGLRRSQAAIEALIAREVERGIPAERIVLMGFSQGCAMTLMTGLRHKQRLGACRATCHWQTGRPPSAAPTTSTRPSSWPTARTIRSCPSNVPQLRATC